MRLIKIFSYITIALLALHAQCSFAASNQKYKDLSIVVVSCDKYQQFWQPFFSLLAQNWPALNNEHKDVPIYLIANKQNFIDSRVKMINVRDEISWSDNMVKALEQVQTKYVLVFLDDYWLKSKVDEARLEQLYKLVREQDAAYIQLFVDSQEKNLTTSVPGIDGVAYKNKFQKYRASLQLAIWETKALKQILRTGESAWDFEMAASIRSSGYPKEFLTVQNNSPILYWNAAHQGHITPQALQLAQTMDPQYTSSLPVLTDNNWDLRLRHVKHRFKTVSALVKRGLGATPDESYRYNYEGRD